MQDLTDRLWVTRRGVRVDRIASAWLIRRWIDSGARFKFVAGKYLRPETAGVAHVLDGIVAGTDDDNLRIERGTALFEGLYRFFAELEP